MSFVMRPMEGNEAFHTPVLRKEAYMSRLKDYMPMVYVASKFSQGDREENLEKTRRYCKFVIGKKGIAMAPHLMMPQFISEDDPAGRELAMRINMIFIDKCDSVWFFGELSPGMRMELDHARFRQKDIHFFNEACEEVELT